MSNNTWFFRRAADEAAGAASREPRPWSPSACREALLAIAFELERDGIRDNEPEDLAEAAALRALATTSLSDRELVLQQVTKFAATACGAARAEHVRATVEGA